MATKFIILPFTFICNLPILIMKFTVSMHLVVFPLADVVSPITKLESTLSCFHPIFFVAFISASSLQNEYNKFSLAVFAACQACLLLARCRFCLRFLVALCSWRFLRFLDFDK